MKKVLIAITPALVFLLQVSNAQQGPAPPLSTNPQRSSSANSGVYISAREIAALMAKADTSVKSGGPDRGLVSLLSQPSIQISMEYDLGPAAQVKTDEGGAQLYRVIEGSGTMTLGGKLISPVRTGSSMVASKAEGGTPYKLHPGDILLVPANTPHSVTGVNGKLAMMSVPIPIGFPNYWPKGNKHFADIGDPSIYISAEDIAGRMARADALIKAGTPDGGPFSLLAQPPYHVTMDDRLIPNGHIDAHPSTAELFVVLDGAGTVVVGGKLVDQKGQGNDLSAPTTDGGTLYSVHKGDIVLVPIGAAHAVIQVDGKLTMMQVHIPLPMSEARPGEQRPSDGPRAQQPLPPAGY